MMCERLERVDLKHFWEDSDKGFKEIRVKARTRLKIGENGVLQYPNPTHGVWQKGKNNGDDNVY